MQSTTQQQDKTSPRGIHTRISRRMFATILCLVYSYSSSTVLAQSSCTFTTEDGSTISFEKGESVHSYRPNRCDDSSSFPCYCNPEVPGQIECPYCWVASMSGDLLCVENGNTLTHNNLEGALETCYCTVSDTEFNSYSMDCQPASPQTRESDSYVSSSVDTCTINGLTFDRGQPLGYSYSSGCSGSSFDFQCICNPDRPDGIECPFCYFDIQKSKDPLCLRNGEIATFQDRNGQTSTCSCTVPTNGELPRSDCSLSPVTSNTCVMEVSDGSVHTFMAGESLHRQIPSRCGAEYPCYCEPSLHGQMWCPFCIFPESNESPICARDGETITYVNRRSQRTEVCSCEVPISRDLLPTATCTTDMTAEQDELVATDRSNGDDDEEEIELQDDDPGDDDSWRVCELEGNLYFEGENVGDSFITRCGSSEEFPCYCNPDMDPPVDCPYCGFALTKENLLCLKHEQVATFVDIDGDELTCRCTAPMGTSTPIENCLIPSSEVNTCVFRDSNGDPFVFEDGDPVDNELLPTSVCGPNFICYCDPSAENQLSCPFCESVDFGGTLLCATDGEFVFYEDDDGTSKQCICEVPDDLSLGEPTLNCDADTPPSPTGSPSPNDSLARPTLNPNDSFGSEPTLIPSGGGTCVVNSPTGETVEVADGDSFGDLAGDGVCGDASDWPAFCNAEGSSSGGFNAQIEYPYCIFENTMSGDPACAKDNDSVTFVDDTGTEVDCFCTYDISPRTTCSPATAPTTERAPEPTIPSGSAQTFSPGQPSASSNPTNIAMFANAILLLMTFLLI